MKEIFELIDYSQWEPYLNAKLVDCHYNMHHMKYVQNLKKADINEYIDVLNDSSKYTKSQVNNALQIYNHNVFWQSMKLQTLKFDLPISEFKTNANSMFGSGWTWLVQNTTTKLVLSINTFNAERPSKEYNILACIDLWEHAYYLQYYGNRANFIDIFCEYLLNYEYIQLNKK